MIKYTIDGGEPFEVDPQNEKQFLIDNPNAKKVEEAGKEEGSSTETSTEQTQINETSPSQNNQQENTESKSEDGSSVSLDIDKSSEEFLNSNPNEVLTYENAPDWFNNRSTFHEDPTYSDSIRKKIYDGTHGFNPSTSVLTKLDKPVEVPKIKVGDEELPASKEEVFKNKVKDISVEDWASMAETDKELNIDGWKDLDSRTKTEINFDFSSRTPITIDTEKGVFGKQNLEDPQLWVRDDWDHKESYFENFFKPLVENGNYTVKVRGGGLKGIPGLWDNSIYGAKGGSVFDGTAHRASKRNYHGIEITHTDPDTDETTKHTIYEYNYDKKGQGINLSKFLDKTMSDSDRIAMGKFQSESVKLYNAIEKKYIDVTKDEKNSIIEEVNNMPLYGEDGEEGIYGTQKPIGKYGADVTTQDDGEYGYILKEVQAKTSNDLINWDELYKDKGGMYDLKMLKPSDSYKEKLKYYLDIGHITEEQYNKYVDDVMAGEYFTFNEKTGKYEGKSIPNPNQMILPDEEALGKDKAIENYVKSEIVNIKIQDKQEQKTGEWKDDVDGDSAYDTMVAIGSNANIQSQIDNLSVLKTKTENWNNKKNEETGLTNVEMHDVVKKHEKNFNDAEKLENIFNPLEVYKEEGVIYGEGDTEEEKQTDAQKKFDIKVEQIKKDNPIIINGEEVEMSQEGYDAAGKRIIDKYTFPTQEEYENKFNEIQKNLNDGKISYEQAQAQWSTYQNDLKTNEQNLQNELKEFDKEYQEQAGKVINKLESFEKEQQEALKRANSRIENWQDEMQDFVVLDDGRKVNKKAFEEYQQYSKILGEEYKLLDGYLKEQENIIGSIEDDTTKNYLIQKNYNDWDKFKFNVVQGFSSLYNSTCYTLIKTVSNITGTDDKWWSENADKNFYHYNKAVDKLREAYQPDVKFENAFDSWGNFGKFFTQEFGVQGPIFLTLMTGAPGMGAMYSSGFAENYSRLVALELENPGTEYSQSYKFFTSMAYGGAEFVDAGINYMGITRAFRAYTSTKKSLKRGWSAVAKEMKNQAIGAMPYTILDISAEGLTTFLQNKIAGRPDFESVDHAMFSAGMFSLGFQLFPFIKGSVMVNFSDSKILNQYRDNLKEITNIEKELAKPNLNLKAKEILEEQRTEIMGNNETILNEELSKLSNMSKEFTTTFFAHVNKSEELRIKYDAILNDKTIDNATKRKLLKKIDTDYNNNEALLEVLKTDAAFGEKFFGFEKSINKDDIKRRNEIFEQAKNELISEGKTDPNDATIRERARVLYNTQEILNDLAKTKNNGLAKDFKSYDTKQDAINDINNMDVSDADKTELIEGIENGNHGATVITNDGKKIPFQVVESMAKDSRLETRTHEKGHYVLEELFGENPQAFNDIAGDIITHLQKHDTGNYLKLMTRVSGYDGDVKAEEVITNFMEMSAEGGLDLKSVQNRNLPSLVGYGLNKIFSNKTKGEVSLDIRGQKDAVNFITQLGKKIKNGDINFRQTKKGRSLVDTKTGRVIGKDIKKKYKKFKQDQSKAFKFSGPAEALNKIVPKSANTKAKFNKWVNSKEGSEAIADMFYSENGIVRNTILKDANYNEDQANRTLGKIIDRIFGKTGFNPEATRADGSKVGAKAFGEFVMAGYSKDKIGTIKQMFEEGKLGPKRDVSGDLVIGESGKTIFDRSEEEGGLSPEELMMIKEETAADKKKTQETLTKVFGIDEKLITQFEGALTTAFGTKLPEVNSKQMRTELGKIISDRLRPIIQKKLGTELQFNEFVKNDLAPLLKFIKAEDLRQLERMVGGKKYPNGRKIFTRSKRITKKQEIIDLQNKGLIPKTFTKYAQGYNLATRLPNPTPEELLAFFRGTNAETILGYQPPGSIKSGMLGARKDKLAELLTREIAFDQAIQVAKNVLPKIKAIESLQNRNIKENYITELGATLDRDPDISGVNTNNSSVKFSEAVSGEIVLEQADLIDVLIRQFGVENVIDENGNFILIGENENISAAAVGLALELNDAGVIEEGQAVRFKEGIYKSDIFPQSLKDLLKKQGNLRYATNEKDLLHKDATTLAELLGPEIMNILGYDILGYYSRVMDSAGRKVDHTATAKAGKRVFKKDKNGNDIMGDYHLRLEKTKKSVSKKNNKAPNNINLSDIRVMNKSLPLFKKIIKIQNSNLTKAEKLKQLEKLNPEIQAANVANIALAKHIAGTIIDLARKGPKNGGISALSAINLLQVQTSAVKGFRGLTRLDLVELLDGPQDMSKNNPLYSRVIKYEKNRGKIKAKGGLTFEQVVIKEKLNPKGEHIDPNANTMAKIAELIYAPQGTDINAELDLVFNNHSQFLGSTHTMDLIDLAPGGKTSTAGFSRLNILKQTDLNNIFSSDGKSFQEVKSDRAFSKEQTKLVKSANIKNSKSSAMYKAKDNLIKFSKKPVVKGMSTFDFDDTLSFTKSGVRATIPNTDGKPKPKRKVIFLAGGAGSGKGNVISKLNLANQGFKIVNSDISLEWLKKNNGLPADMRELTSEQRSILGKLGHESRKIARNKMMKYQGNANGVVVDGTGGSVKSMQNLVNEFKSKGYDVSMLFVDTSLDVALERNRARKERSLLDTIVKRNHESVQGNKPTFKDMFGNRFMEVNTDNITQQDPMPSTLVKQMDDFVSSYEKVRLDATEFAEQGDVILAKGGKFDFSEFNDVVDGKPGPLMDKARSRAKKYGTKDMFVLTARPQASAPAIKQFLDSQGINIPLKNITGLANSTGNAKAQWMLEKFAEGYNDMYFVDDAIQNVEAVKQVLDQLDIKSKVVQAKIKFSKNASKEFNKIIEESKGINAKKVISQAEAMKTGRNKGWWRIFVPPSAEDFKGLLYRFLGTGKQGDQHMAWFKENLLDPFAKGIRSWNTYKQGMVNEYKQLRKDFKEVSKSLYKNVKGTAFNTDAAIRVYLWDKAGFDIPGIDNATKQKLIDHVLNNNKIKQYADTLSKITRLEEGYIKPKEGWAVGTIASDLNNIVNKIGRKQFLADYLANAEAIFTPENMNKIEAVYGTNFRKALENIMYRMENGTNRRISPDSNVNNLLDWINGSVGAIMFFNMRSAVLQTLSTVNFINWNDNNIFKAAKAFANQPQFWKDFAMIFNSPQLKQRRGGLQTDVNAAELAATFSDGKVTPRKLINYLLQLGFKPTQIVDSFAIAFGGASMYRNRFNTYKKQGMTDKQASDQAMLDMQEIAEETQQSSREDMVSGQQASVLGRVVLAFQNVTMQYTRLTKKALSDLVNRRGDPKTNISKIMYYGAVQSFVFLALQQALANSLWGDDEDEKDKDIKRVFNGTLDSFLRGIGLHGAVVSTVKNTYNVYKEEKDKTWNREDAKILLELLSFSPPIGSKARKVYQAIRSEYYDKGGKLSEELGWRIESPKLYFWASLLEAGFNLPTQRLVRKANNLEEAITGNHSTWNRIMLGLGWSTWELGLEDEDKEAAKKRIDEKKKIEKEKEKEQKKIEKEKAKEEEKKKEEEEKKKKGIKTVRCSGIRSNGQRCKITTETADKKFLCVHHKPFKDGSDTDGDGKKEYRCTATKSNGKRCKNKTENKNKKCYAHQ